ncbi:ribosome biogenesis GTPase Der [Lyticum sinuosum]|uniref:GTPase Der n=1 Tax=Lyticum sinuosum TaxID=1332059 RepID=A0AAE4VLQ3_9RICK|nr:ribosome biogenesis GTPase Der [Lyticum sinuosum]MDZ5761587.1 GTPase Der [Lyticum sinuosum]
MITKNNNIQNNESKLSTFVDNRLPKIAIVGKPNVGKSTLLNNLCHKKIAITDDRPGVTRDRKYFSANLLGWEFIAIDTAGWDISDQAKIHKEMINQTMIAIKEADAIIFIVDGKNGLSSLDFDFIKEIRRIGKKIILVVNKTESKISVTISELFSLGLGDPVFISATHSIGFNSLHDRLIEIFPKQIYRRSRNAKPITTITICGQPNVGKSTIFNVILEEERSIVDSQPGTTRDSISATYFKNIESKNKINFISDEKITNIQYTKNDIAIKNNNYENIDNNNIFINRNDNIKEYSENNSENDYNLQSDNPTIVAELSEIELVDTAGMRRRSKVTNENFEFNSVGQSIASIRRADVVILVMDVQKPLNKQDLNIAKMIVNEGKGIVIVFNKIDTISIEELTKLKEDVKEILPNFINEVISPPIIYTSAINRQNVKEIIQISHIIKILWKKSFNTALLNRWLNIITKDHPPSRGKNNILVKIKYMNQIATQPPTFQLFSNTECIADNYISYIRNKMAEKFNLFGIPLRFICKKSSNPYVDKKINKSLKQSVTKIVKNTKISTKNNKLLSKTQNSIVKNDAESFNLIKNKKSGTIKNRSEILTDKKKRSEFKSEHKLSSDHFTDSITPIKNTYKTIKKKDNKKINTKERSLIRYKSRKTRRNQKTDKN